MHKFLSLCILMFLSSCGKPAQKDPSKITIAASSLPQADLLKQAEPELKKEGITLQIQIIDDYNIPNRALTDGEIDANFFQHKPFLDEQIQEFGYPLCILANIHIEPMGIYSLHQTSLNQLKENGMIAIPSDPTNEARALFLLEKAGLITLKKRNDRMETVRDIEENPKHFRFKEVDAALLTRILPEAEAAVIPTNYALLAGLSPQKNALLVEDSASPYVNVIVIRCSDKEKPQLLLLKKAMQSENLQTYILKEYQGAVVPAF